MCLVPHRRDSKTMSFLEIILYFLEKLRNYQDCKFFKIFLIGILVALHKLNCFFVTFLEEFCLQLRKTKMQFSHTQAI